MPEHNCAGMDAMQFGLAFVPGPGAPASALAGVMHSGLHAWYGDDTGAAIRFMTAPLPLAAPAEAATGGLWGTWLAEEGTAAARIVPMGQAVSAEVQGARLGGRLYGEGQLVKLESYLGRRNVTLVRDADEFLAAQGANGLFRANANGTGALYLRSNPTQYEVWHELQHFRDFRNTGFDAYKALQRVGREQSVYDVLSGARRWPMLNAAEQDHAFRYILSLDGNPFGMLP